MLRGRPGIDADAGIFLSVAARLVHGDHLYTGVWDHKPPFFYYAHALAFDLGGWRGPFLLDAFWVSIATISIWLLLRAIGVSPWTRTVGAAVYPLMLTGAWYYAGYSELPALALAPAILWLSLRRSTLAAGGSSESRSSSGSITDSPSLPRPSSRSAPARTAASRSVGRRFGRSWVSSLACRRRSRSSRLAAS
jgi:hypothetical protein